MYNRYIPGTGGYVRIPQEDAPPPHRTEQGGTDVKTPSHPHGEAHSKAEKSAGAIAALLKGLKLDRLDGGDALLLLILLFLFMEGDDVELMITLGLILLLGLE